MNRETFFRYLVVTLILSAGVVLSAVGYSVIRNGMEREAHAEFQRAFQDRVRQITVHLEQRSNILRNLAAFHDASNTVDRSEFRTFVSSQLEQSDGIQALEWVPRVTAAERQAYEEAAASRFPGFRIAERNLKGDLVAAESRDEYFPVYFIEPIGRNAAAVGFDLGSSQVRKRALSRARDTGEASASGRIRLIQETGSQFGFLVFHPVYSNGAAPANTAERRQRLQGFVIGVFRVGDVINAALDQLEPRGVNITVTDSTEGEIPAFLHTHFSRLPSKENTESIESRAGESTARPFIASASIPVSGRTWTITGHGASRFFPAAGHSWQAWIILFGGLGGTILLGLFFNILMRRSSDVRRLVDVRTRELSESQGHLKAIFDTVADGIVTIDQRGIIRSSNPATSAIFGYGTEEIVGQNIKILAAPPHQRHHDRYIANYLRTGESRIIDQRREVEGQRKDGTTFPLELAVAPLELGAEPLFLGITRDITKRKAADRMKEEFVSTISHELRTPLTVILGYLPMLTDGGKMPEPEMVAHIAGKMEISGQHLLDLVDELLDVSQLDAGAIKLDMNEVDLQQVIRGAAAELEQSARARNLFLKVDADPCRARADQKRLRQILINLIGNAIKFTAEGGVSVRSRFDPETGEAVISVSDSGPGIPKEQLGCIFDRFRQIDSSSTRGAGGTGLGLAIAKTLVELHGGGIRVDSWEAKGSCFTFTLPHAIAGRPAKPISPGEEREAQYG